MAIKIKKQGVLAFFVMIIVLVVTIGGFFLFNRLNHVQMVNSALENIALGTNGAWNNVTSISYNDDGSVSCREMYCIYNGQRYYVVIDSDKEVADVYYSGLSDVGGYYKYTADKELNNKIGDTTFVTGSFTTLLRNSNNGMEDLKCKWIDSAEKLNNGDYRFTYVIKAKQSADLVEVNTTREMTVVVRPADKVKETLLVRIEMKTSSFYVKDGEEYRDVWERVYDWGYGTVPAETIATLSS